MNKLSKRIIGLTGGIGTGKTTVSNYLANIYKIPVLDADIYARQAVMPNSPIFQKILIRYGSKIVDSNGELNRQALGEIIFNNSLEKQWLESEIHPFVYNCFVHNINKINAPIVVLAIPLLFEAKMTDLVNEIWVVTCDFPQQIARITSRNNLTEKQAIARIENQLPLGEKVALADIIIDNNGNLDNLFRQIDRQINYQGKL